MSHLVMDPLDPHVGIFAVGVVALAFLIGVVFFRDEVDSPQRRWLLLFAVVIFPALAMFLGLGRAMEDAKRPEFCGSCHVMKPWIADLTNPESETLAATHYKNRYILENQCYTCHSEYTMFGPMKAKLAGVGHLVRYVTGAYEHPLKLREPYHFDNCARCHAGAKVFQDTHADSLEDLASGNVTCLDCHAPVHPDQEGE